LTTVVSTISMKVPAITAKVTSHLLTATGEPLLGVVILGEPFDRSGQ
jgi:hypothetical protein